MSDVAEHRPRFTASAAEELAANHWNINGTARELPSDRDQNFLIKASTREVVLKIAAADEVRSVLELQNDAMTLLGEHDGGTPVAAPVPGQHGAQIVDVTGSDTRTFLARMVTWLPGTPMALVQPHSADLLRSLGRTMGTVTNGLKNLQSDVRRELRWDLRNAFGVFDKCGPLINEPHHRTLFDQTVAEIRERTQPLLTNLKVGWIHNDANDHNVLVADRAGEQTVCGLIDFGDMTHSWIVGELAIACAYAMLNKPRAVAVACEVVAGFHSARSLEPLELQVLFDLIRMRLCTSVAICAEQKRAEPDNEYLTVSEQPAWNLLQQLAKAPAEWATAMFRHACGMEPCSRSRSVVEWLREAQPHSMVPDSPHELFVHDLSVSSSEPAASVPATNPFRFERLMREERLNQSRTVGVGRYNEPRLCYLSDQFATETGARRTIHIGLDIFAESGTRVFAPFDGTVHSTANNNLPLDYGPTIILRHQPDDGPEFFTLYGHLSEPSIEGLSVGDEISRGQELAAFGSADVNGGWAPHLHFQLITDMLGKTGDFPGVAPPDERAVWLSLCPDPNLIARLPIDGTRYPDTSTSELSEQRKRHLGPSLSLSYREPLHIVRGSGCTLFDASGRGYLDTVNNVAHVGHAHPRVVDAIQRQAKVLNTNTRYLHSSIVEYAERLTARFPAELNVCFFVCSGSEANELALRMAAAHTGADQVIVLDSGYHGNTAACIAASAYKFDGPGGSGAGSHIHKVRTPDPYRVRGFTDGDAAADDVRVAVEQMNARPAAFLAETIASCGGQIVPPDGYLKAAYAHTRNAGAVCIADEVQTGFGRVGSHFWAFETQGVVPDIVTLGKSIGNGHPMGAVVTTRAIAESFANGMEYFNTCGGNPVSCEVGLAVLDVIEEEGLQQRALTTGNAFQDRLRDISDQHPLIGDVRGRGLFLGIELVRDAATLEPADTEAAYVVERLKEHFILASTDGPAHNVIKIKPPMVFQPSDAARYCDALETILADTSLGDRPHAK